MKVCVAVGRLPQLDLEDALVFSNRLPGVGIPFVRLPARYAPLLPLCLAEDGLLTQSQALSLASRLALFEHAGMEEVAALSDSEVFPRLEWVAGFFASERPCRVNPILPVAPNTSVVSTLLSTDLEQYSCVLVDWCDSLTPFALRTILQVCGAADVDLYLVTYRCSEFLLYACNSLQVGSQIGGYRLVSQLGLPRSIREDLLSSLGQPPVRGTELLEKGEGERWARIVHRRLRIDLLRRAFPREHEEAFSILTEVMAAQHSMSEASLLEIARSIGVSSELYYKLTLYDFLSRHAIPGGYTVSLTWKGVVAVRRYKEKA